MELTAGNKRVFLVTVVSNENEFTLDSSFSFDVATLSDLTMFPLENEQEIVLLLLCCRFLRDLEDVEELPAEI